VLHAHTPRAQAPTRSQSQPWWPRANDIRNPHRQKGPPYTLATANAAVASSARTAGRTCGDSARLPLERSARLTNSICVAVKVFSSGSCCRPSWQLRGVVTANVHQGVDERLTQESGTFAPSLTIRSGRSEPPWVCFHPVSYRCSALGASNVLLLLVAVTGCLLVCGCASSGQHFYGGMAARFGCMQSFSRGRGAAWPRSRFGSASKAPLLTPRSAPSIRPCLPEGAAPRLTGGSRLGSWQPGANRHAKAHVHGLRVVITARSIACMGTSGDWRLIDAAARRRPTSLSRAALQELRKSASKGARHRALRESRSKLHAQTRRDEPRARHSAAATFDV
jgi:hypothetical protein